jgi:hypothetical protein
MTMAVLMILGVMAVLAALTMPKAAR